MSELIGWWPLHETNGAYHDYAGISDGTANGPARGVAGVGGIQAASFDGSNDYVDCGTAVLHRESKTDFSFGGWFRTTAGSTGNMWILSCMDGDGGYRMELDSGSVKATLRSSEAITTVGSSSGYADGLWHHAMCTFDYDGSMSLYVDGDQVATNSRSNPTDPGTSLYIGSSSYFGGDFHGELCSIRIYNRALSSSEVQTLYNMGSLKDNVTPRDADDSGSISRWPLNETSGSTANDPWGNNDGDINGATLGVTGVLDTAFSFDGGDFVGTALSYSSSRQHGLTTCGWIRNDSNNGASNGRYWSTDLSDYFGVWRGNGTNTVELSVRTDTDVNLTTPPFTVRDDVWSHWALVFKPNDYFAAYKNGIQVHYETHGYSGFGTGAVTRYLNIGDGSEGGQNTAQGVYSAGDIDDVRVYHAALEPHEIYEIYREGTGGTDLRQFMVSAR